MTLENVDYLNTGIPILMRIWVSHPRM